jgi:hypothetical protein
VPRAAFTHAVTVPATTSAAWDRLQLAETWSNIGPVERVWDEVVDADGILRSHRWPTSVGPREYRGTATTSEVVPQRLMRIDLDAGELRGRLSTTLSANGRDDTHLEVTLEIEPRGTLSILFFGVISDAIGRGLPSQVEHFAAGFAG